MATLASFLGKYAILSVTNGKYLSIDQSNGQILATAGSITLTETFIAYTTAYEPPMNTIFGAATEANHNLLAPSNCWNSNGLQVPYGCMLTATAATLAKAAQFIEDDTPNYHQQSGQDQWTAAGLEVSVPFQLGLGIEFVIVDGSSQTTDRLFIMTQLVPGFSSVACGSGGNWVDADLSFVSLAQVPEALSGNTANFTGANLEGISFSGLDLSSVTISNNANLNGADFSNCTLPPSFDLSQATLTGVNFSAVDLTSVKLSASVNLTGANLSGANMAGLVLTNANLSGANLTGATLTNVNLSNANLEGTNFSSCNLTTVSFNATPQFSRSVSNRTAFEKATLNVSILGSNWAYLDLSGATLVGLPPSYTSLQAQNALLRNLVLNNVSFVGAIFDGSDLTSTTFNGCTLTGASFRGVTLTLAELTGVKAEQAVFDGSTMNQATLTNGDFTSGSFQNVFLYAAAVTYTNLTSANFTGAQCGAKNTMFTLPLSLVPDIIPGPVTTQMVQAFSQNKVTLSQQAIVTNRVPNVDWLIVDGDNTYEIVATAANLTVLGYLNANQAAAFSSAYMPNAVFTDANLYAVNLSGAQWYGPNAAADNADLEEADLSGANLGTITLAQARLFGVTLDSANLVTANLSGAWLQPSASNKAASLVSASLEGTLFTQAHMDSANLTNAAVALAYGVPLFPLSSSMATELNSGLLTQDVTNAFVAAGYTLLSGATLAVVTAGSQWTVTNTEPNPTNLGSIYQTFTIVAEASNLMVYGASLWVTQLGPNNTLMTLPFNFGQTDLQASYMTAGSYCPNGEQLSKYLSNELTWEQMMTANDPPAPPACVPSPLHWCPNP